jgi:ABC-type lipoprotein release transport system permease subunit
MISISDSLIKAVTNNITGDVIITSPEATFIDVLTKAGEKRIINLEEWEKLLAFTRDLEYVENASPRLRYQAILHSESNLSNFVIIGVDPESEKDLLPSRTVMEGNWFKDKYDMLLYSLDSDLLNVDLGAELLLTMYNINFEPNHEIVNLTGILDYKEMSFYMEMTNFCFISLELLNEVLMTDETYVGELFIRLKDSKDVVTLKKDIKETLGMEYKYVLPQDSAPFIQNIHILTYFTILSVSFLLLLIVYLCSSFIVSVTIESRRQEIGIYQAFGVPKWRIGILFSGEYFLVMALFGIIGFSLAYLIMSGLTENGIIATIFPLKLIFGREVLYILNRMESYAILTGLLLFAFLGNIILAIRKLNKLNPVEVMREI